MLWKALAYYCRRARWQVSYKRWRRENSAPLLHMNNNINLPRSVSGASILRAILDCLHSVFKLEFVIKLLHAFNPWPAKSHLIDNYALFHMLTSPNGGYHYYVTLLPSQLNHCVMDRLTNFCKVIAVTLCLPFGSICMG